MPASVSLLATKLYPPAIRPGRVLRPRLLAQLAMGEALPFILVSAPPGFGKSTLLGEWLARMGAGRPAPDAPRLAWLSLDADDNDPAQFFRYLVAALRDALADAGEAALTLLSASQPPPPQVIVHVLLNELAASAKPVVVVLDDYHVIEQRAISEAVATLIERLPPHAHVAITTRADPPFPLARWRASGRMVEIRQDDLRFTQDETRAFVEQAASVRLSDEQLAVVEARTEGWAAALQLGVLAGKDKADPALLVATFTGSHRYLMDYLTDEVHARQSPKVQAFLSATSVLRRMCAGLCHAVLVEAGGEAATAAEPEAQAILETLERANLFVIPLDDARRWYRYHPLFAEAMRARLRRDRPSDEAALHRRASAWFASHGLIEEAIHHALDGKDHDAAAGLIERHAEHMLWRGAVSSLRALIEALPDAAIAPRPRLLINHALILAGAQRFDAAAARLDQAERTDALRSADAAERSALLAEADVVRTMILLGESRFEETIDVGRRALRHLPATAARQRAAALQRMGTASGWLGNMRQSIEHYVEARQLSIRHDDVPSVIRCEMNLIGLQASPQTVRATREQLRDLLAYAARHGLDESANAGFILRIQAEAEYDLNNIEETLALVGRAIEIAVRDDVPHLEAISRSTRARALAALGRADEAVASAENAHDLTLRYQMAVRYTAVVHAARLWAWLAAGRHDDAAAWLRANPIDLAQYVSVRATEYRARARCLLAVGDAGGARAVLDRVVADADANAIDAFRFPALLLRTVVLRRLGELDAAREALGRALALGEPQRLVRAYLDEGAPMADALRDWRARAAQAEARLIGYADALLDAMGAAPLAARAAAGHPALSERELEILRLIVAGASNKAIAARLFIAEGTVKKHAFNVYGKLGVTSRTQAAAKARDLGLL